MALNEDQQTEAVFKSNRTDVDPVSGNEVPPGSLPEEVRDDIPAMLSEGEYVVPADVLRFYGVKFFEDLRAQAKIGLAEMDANGRIGGEPIEEETGAVGISDEDLLDILYKELQEEQTVGAAKGGVMGFQAGGLNYPAYIKQPDITQFGMAGPDFQGGLEYRTYVNDAGMEITIPFFDGQPMGMIPPGYTLKSDTPTATEQAAPQQVGQDDGPSPEDLGRPEAVDYSTLTDDELSEALDQNNTAKSVTTALSAVNPAIAIFGRLATAHQRSQITEEMAKRGMEEPEEDESPLSNIVEGIKGLFSKDEDKDEAKDTTPTAPTSPESKDEPEPFSGFPKGPTPAQVAQAEQEATIGLEAFGGTGDDNDNEGTNDGTNSGANSSGANSSGVSGTNDGEVGEATGGQGDQGKGSGKGGMNQGGMMKKPKKNKKK